MKLTRKEQNEGQLVKQVVSYYSHPEVITDNLNAEFSAAKNGDEYKAKTRQGYKPTTLPPQLEQHMKRRASGANTSSVMQGFHSPFRTRQAVEQPTKRKDRNEWYRYYFKFDPIVHTAIQTHSTFPLSRFRVEHDDPEFAEFLNEMANDINLHDLMIRMAVEYFVVGECFCFGFFDDAENPTRWQQFILIDPDKVFLNTHSFAHAGGHPYVIEMEPDKDLKKIVENGPNDGKTGPLYKNLPPDIIKYVKDKENIPVPEIQISHFKREVNPFQARGESILSCVLADLMYLDKLREGQWCHRADTEVLTNNRGFVSIAEITLQDDVATFNKETEEIEYLNPTKLIEKDYSGKMMRFKNRNINVDVTPNHRMLIRGTSTNKDWKVVRADEVKHTYRMRTNGKWGGGNDVDSVFIEDIEWEIMNFLKFSGYYISEGCTSHCNTTYMTAITQSRESEWFDDIVNVCDEAPMEFSTYIQKHKDGARYGSSTSMSWVMKSADRNSQISYRKKYYEYFKDNFGATSYDKKIPQWIKNLKPKYLENIISTLVNGDGTEVERKNGSSYYRYATVSKRLADDVMEIVFKAGYNPNLNKPELLDSGKYIYKVCWNSDKSANLEHSFMSAKKQPDGTWKSDKDNFVENYDYDGKVYCLEVPNGFFVTRLQGKLSIHGNCIVDRHITPKEMWYLGEPDKPADQQEINDFQNLLLMQYHMPNQAYVFHHAVRFQMEGAGGRVLPLQPEFDFVTKRLYAGLGINEAMITSSGPSFASSSVAMDIMVGRYEEFRQRMEQWLIHKVFKPLCKIHGIYKKHSERNSRFRKFQSQKVPDLPRIVWEKVQLRDEMQKIQTVERLVQQGVVPREELYKLLNYSPEQMYQEFLEQNKIDIQYMNKLQKIRKEMGVPESPAPGGLPAMGGAGGPLGGGMPPGGMGAGMPGGGMGGPPPGGMPGMPGGLPPGGGGASTPSPLGGGSAQRPPDSNRATQMG